MFRHEFPRPRASTLLSIIVLALHSAGAVAGQVSVRELREALVRGCNDAVTNASIVDALCNAFSAWLRQSF